uniref:Zinc finger protein 2 homolog n=1 Tax=Stegastes partitus TaxID=144197 RepID=A0A3B4ZRB9_9TELE
MATATLQSFNVFLTERLTAAAVDIYGFVERTVVEYQEEVNRAQQENQRLQRLLDLVYKPQIRLHRAGMQVRGGGVDARFRFSDRREEVRVRSVFAPCQHIANEGVDDDGDALTKELIKTVQQLEDCRAAEESRESKQTAVDDPMLSEEKTSTTLYRCHICNYIFTKKTVLTWHLKTHEGKSQDAKGNFDCHICGKHIPCQSNLQNHMRVHTGERPYSCHFCGKCFKLKGHMTEHIRTHTGEKKHVLAKHKEERPYKCGNCDELFTERLLMKRHMRKVHGVKLPTSQSPA